MDNRKILIVQRVITPYRLELLKGLCGHFLEVVIITSRGEKTGTLKRAKPENLSEKNLKVKELKSLRIGYTGESRSTSLFAYPQIVFLLLKYDVLLLEGTTNLLNNLLIIPFGRFFGKTIVWWDAGYSPETRTKKRKIIDFFVRPLVRMTDLQMAYSTKGESYMRNHMGARNSFVNLNTINTTYFEQIKSEVNNSILNYEFDERQIKLLYVGVIEKRKKVEELLEVIKKLNSNNIKRKYSIDIIGGGKQLDELIAKNNDGQIVFHGPIYDKDKLKKFYFNSDLFVLPGDGGLGILQSLLYGLPVLCLRGADGTERDYIRQKHFLLKGISEIYGVLDKLEAIDRKPYLNYVDTVSSKKWIENLISKIELLD